MKIAFFGAGAWGTALAQHASARHPVLLVTRDAEQARDIDSARRNRRYLPEVALNPTLQVTADQAHAFDWLNQADDAHLVVISSSMAGLPGLVEQVRSRKPRALIWLSKGLLPGPEGGVSLAHQIVSSRLPGVPAGPLLGPSFALEVARGLPAALTVATTSDALAATAVDAFHFGGLRIYRSDDVLGVELGGALKNVVAIATGICDGLGLGNNARAALITRGLAETARLGLAMGARAETFMGLTGLGDLVLTATGDLSRNRKVGIELAHGRSLPQILAGLGHVAEGVNSVEAALGLSRRFKVELPICAAVASVIRGQATAMQAVQQLLAREPKHEIDGGV